MTDSRKAEPAIQAYSSEKDFSRQGSPFCVGWGAWKNMKNHEKPYNRTLSEEMQLIRRLHRHLPFQGKVKTGLRPFFPVWEGEVSGAWEMRGVPFVRSSSHPFPLYPLVSYSFPLSLYQGIT